MKPVFHRRAFWSIAGLFLLAFAGWEAVQIARGGRTGFVNAHLPPPLQSRSGERPLLVRETQTGDPIANYLARAKRGMTEQEVRWMLEDFEAQGLDRSEDQLPDFAAAKVHRKKLEAWYLSALSEGLSLTAAQKEEVKAKLESRFASDLQNIEALKNWSAEWKEKHPGHTLCGADLSDAYRRFFQFPATLFHDSSFAPWNVSQLTEIQSSITLRFWRIEDDKHQNENDPFASSDQTAEPRDWLYTAKGMEGSDPFSDSPQSTLRETPGVPAMQDPLSGNLTAFPNYTELWTATSEDGQCVEAYLPCGNILPLTPDQMPLWEKSYDLAAQALLCHPAQLRLALLQQPGLPQTLRKELDREPPQKVPNPPVKPAASAVSE